MGDGAGGGGGAKEETLETALRAADDRVASLRARHAQLAAMATVRATLAAARKAGAFLCDLFSRGPENECCYH